MGGMILKPRTNICPHFPTRGIALTGFIKYDFHIAIINFNHKAIGSSPHPVWDITQPIDQSDLDMPLSHVINKYQHANPPYFTNKPYWYNFVPLFGRLGGGDIEGASVKFRYLMADNYKAQTT